jgi:endonuclease III
MNVSGRAVRCREPCRLSAQHGYTQRPRRMFWHLNSCAVADLLKVPGVGPYTAGAIASIAFGQTAAIVDGSCPRPAALPCVCHSEPPQEMSLG